ncbi:MAG: hypothetical protein HQ556_12905 [Candidatus Marinimicrobia bacterium]|nr:hypothetical protein [Candidatus Neomarinimicrobiota bacterium]
MKLLKITVYLILIIILVPHQLDAWYPKYSVLATDFPVRNDFLRPLSLRSAALQGMGEYFQYLYPVQPDFRFLDPTYPLAAGRHLFYMDLGSERLKGSEESGRGGSPGYYGESSSFIRDYGFWSPYRELSHEQIPEPSFRLFYLNRLGDSEGALNIGGSYSLAYDETVFYKPYNYYSMITVGSVGNAYDRTEVYEDYRLREAGDDESISTEHQLNLFLSKVLSKGLSVGARLGMVRSEVDGNLRDYQFTDFSDWADVYERYYDNDLKRNQSQELNDFNIGFAYETPLQERIAINAGLTSGSLERDLMELDTSRYISICLNPDANDSTLDTNIYRSSSYYKSNKTWLYEGNGYYIRFISEHPQSEGLKYRFGGLIEWRSADLTESESEYRRRKYFNQYWRTYDNTQRRYSDRSNSSVERTGSGQFTSKFYNLSGGVEWELQPILNFYGGIYFEHFDRFQDSREPFVGEKSSINTREGYTYYNYTNYEAYQSDSKTYLWEQHQWRTTLAVPVGVEYQVRPSIGLQAGLTKIFQRTRVEEGYDVIIEAFHFVETEDGVIVRDENDSDYVDGYEYPVIKDFSDRFDFNAGLNLRSGDRLRLSVVLTNVGRDAYAAKVGGSISW